MPQRTPPRQQLVDPAPPVGQPPAARNPHAGAKSIVVPSELPPPVEREQPSASSSSSRANQESDAPVEPEFTRGKALLLLTVAQLLSHDRRALIEQLDGILDVQERPGLDHDAVSGAHRSAATRHLVAAPH